MERGADGIEAAAPIARWAPPPRSTTGASRCRGTRAPRRRVVAPDRASASREPRAGRARPTCERLECDDAQTRSGSRSDASHANGWNVQTRRGARSEARHANGWNAKTQRREDAKNCRAGEGSSRHPDCLCERSREAGSAQSRPPGIDKALELSWNRAIRRRDAAYRGRASRLRVFASLRSRSFTDPTAAPSQLRVGAPRILACRQLSRQALSCHGGRS